MNDQLEPSDSVNNKTTPGRSRIFWLFQLLLVPVAIALGGWTWTNVNSFPLVPQLMNEPRIIRPVHDYPLVVSDEQLQTVLYKLRPRFETQPPKTNFVDHALRMWGSSVVFGDDALDGQQMRDLLIDDQQFRKYWKAKTPSLLKSSPYGVAVRTQEGRATVSHVDHLIGTLAEIGTPLDHPIRLANESASMHDLVHHTFRSFRLNQKEYEWTAVAWALYAPSRSDWYTADRQQITMERLAERMMRQQQPQGVCYGQHRLYSLTLMLRADNQLFEQQGDRLLTEEGRATILTYLHQMTGRLYRNQSQEGWWDGNWPDLKQAIPDPGTDALSRRILATGHTLEWWAMAPRELHPPRETIVRAGQWLTRTISEMDDRLIQKNYTFLTHAGRALALWRAKFPGEVYQQVKVARISNHQTLMFSQP